MRSLCIALLASLLPALTAQATVIHVPGQQPSIQAGILAATHQETVLVACGTYYEHDIQLVPGITLLSSGGQADCVTIDAQRLGRGLVCIDIVSPTTVQGFTITGAGQQICSRGAGLYCSASSLTVINCTFVDNSECDAAGAYCRLSPVNFHNCTFTDNITTGRGAALYFDYSAAIVSNCTFAGNQAGNRGGGIYCFGDAPTITDCEFVDNYAPTGGAISCNADCTALIESCRFTGNGAFYGGGAVASRMTSWPVFSRCVFRDNAAQRSGGAVFCQGSTVELASCTLWENQARGDDGGGIYLDDGSLAVVRNCIVAGSTQGDAVHCNDPASYAALICCNLYGNAGGDWVSCVTDQQGMDGNFSAPPLFCDAANGDFTLHADSPCAPDQSPSGCGLIGAGEVACAAASVPVAEPPAGARMLRVVPNPLRGTGCVEWSGEPGSWTRWRLFDVSGRLVRTQPLALTGDGPHRIAWQAIAGEAGLASGIYYLELAQPGTAARPQPARIVVLR